MGEPDHAHFQSIPWCSEILTNSEFAITPTFSRHSKPHFEDTLTASTLKNDDAIKACISVYRRPAKKGAWIDEVRSMMTLGNGMNGGPYLLHGGITATLIDDCVGTLMTVNEDQESMPLSSSSVTAYLNVQYLQPITTPQTILVVARCREVEGRKLFMDAEIRDSEGEVLAKADTLWIRINRPPKERL